MVGFHGRGQGWIGGGVATTVVDHLEGEVGVIEPNEVDPPGGKEPRGAGAADHLALKDERGIGALGRRLIFDLPLSQEWRGQQGCEQERREEFHRVARLLGGDGHQGLKVGRFRLAINHGNLDLLESGIFEKSGHVEF